MGGKLGFLKFFSKTADVAEDAFEFVVGDKDEPQYGRGRNGNKRGFLDKILGGGVGKLLKGGGTAGLFLMLIKMLMDIAKSGCTDEEWDGIMRPVKDSMDNLLDNFGMKTPKWLVSNMGLLETRETVKNLTEADQERIADELNQGFPEEATRELDQTLQFHNARLKDELGKINARTSKPLTDKFGSVESTATADLSLDGLDSLFEVNRTGVTTPNQVEVTTVAKSRSL